MNYFKELEKKQEKELNYINFYSDYTYEVFEGVIRESIPLAIEQYLTMHDNTIERVKITFCFFDIYHDPISITKTAILRDTDSSINYDRVNVDEFKSYMEAIPGVLVTYNGDMALYSFNIRELIQYYYEELERIEYQTGKSR